MSLNVKQEVVHFVVVSQLPQIPITILYSVELKHNSPALKQLMECVYVKKLEPK